MKSLKLLFAVMALIFISNVGYSLRIVTYVKSGGGLFGHKSVSSSFTGYDAANDIYHWHVNCTGHGFNKCKWKLGISDPGAPATNVLTAVEAKIEKMFESIDISIGNGRKKGYKGGKVSIVRADGRHELVIIRMSWEHDAALDKTKATVRINEAGNPANYNINM